MLEVPRWSRSLTGWNGGGLLVWRRFPVLSAPRIRPRRNLPPLGWISFVLVLLGAVVYEERTSAVQSWAFSRFSGRLTYVVASGESDSIAFPREGPFNERLGYTRIPDFQRKLVSAGYRVTAQSRF